MEPIEVEIRLEPALPDVKVVIHAPARTEQVEALAARLSGMPEPLWGFRGEEAVPLRTDGVLRFYGEDKAVRAQTVEAIYTVRPRLYELEQLLPPGQFVRISHSEIVNLRQVTGLDLSLTGTIRMTLSGGTACYVSRRYVKKIKEALGL